MLLWFYPLAVFNEPAWYEKPWGIILIVFLIIGIICADVVLYASLRKRRKKQIAKSEKLSACAKKILAVAKWKKLPPQSFWYIVGAVLIVCAIVCLWRIAGFMEDSSFLDKELYRGRGRWRWFANMQYDGFDEFFVAASYSALVAIRAFIYTVAGIGFIIIGKLTALRRKD